MARRGKEHVQARSASLLVLCAWLPAGCDGLPGSNAADSVVQRPVVTIESGSLRGVSEDGVTRYLGIPYAAPPVRDLRWRPPQPPASWDGVRAVYAFANDCMQHRTPTRQPQSEDCLFLNVWRPTTTEGQPLSVMFWIHGGNLTGGSSASSVYNGAHLAKQGIVVVSINYRLARFGFFAHPALTTDDTDGLLGNYGFMDQIEALLWVQRNIAAFGGNPGDVTVFGESAGARSVHALLTSPLSRDLFHKAIIQSGASRPRLRRIREDQPSEAATPQTDGDDRTAESTAEAMGVGFAPEVGLEDPSAAELRALPSQLVRGPKGDFAPAFPDAMIDGRLLRADYVDTYAQGLQHRVPVLIGANSLEASFGDSLLTGDLGFLGSLGDAIADVRALYDGYGTGDDALVALEMEGDMLQVSGTLRHARLLAAAGTPVYLYHFSYVPESRRDADPAARHASELPFVFDAPSNPTPVDLEVANLMTAYWTQFAKTGNPNRDDLPAWPAFSAENNQLLEFTTSGRAMVRTGFEVDKMDFWDGLYDSGWSYQPRQHTAEASEPETPAASHTPSSSPQ